MANNMKIYTRTGDRGQTSLFGGTRVLKSHDRVETYGTLDELNSAIGAVVAHLGTKSNALQKELEQIQHDLFAIGSTLARPVKKELPYLMKRVEEFEKSIDTKTKKLPELRQFILPGGSKTGSQLHMARTICRRLERRLVALLQTEEMDETIVKYINRLSDLLFTMARLVNQQEKKREVHWISHG